MKNRALRLQSFLFGHKVISGLGILAFVGVVIFLVFNGGGEKQPQTIVVERGTVRTIVGVSGRVQPAEEVNLAFGTSGRVANIGVSVGQSVSVGQRIASLENGVLVAEYERLSAMVRAEELRLQQLYAGPSMASRGVSSVSIESARADGVVAERALVDEVISARTDVDIAVRTYLDSLFSSPTSSSPDFGVSITSGATTYFIGSLTNESAINSKRRQIQEELDDLHALNISDIESDSAGSVLLARQTLLDAQSLADMVADAVNKSQPSDSSAKTVYDSYKSNIVSARSTVGNALSALNASDQAAIRARFAITSAQRRFDADVETPTSFEIGLQEASIDQARAQLRGAQARLAEGYIVSPIRGVVTDIAVYPGEIASPSVVAITVISDDPYQLEAFIPEVDIASIGVGDEASISFDALGASHVFSARIAEIEPVQTDSQGVPTYRVVLFLDKELEGLKPGMTADIDIVAETREDALSIPARAVVRRGGEVFVRIMASSGEPELIPVTVGIRGENGTIEIVSGLERGDAILAGNE